MCPFERPPTRGIREAVRSRAPCSAVYGGPVRQPRSRQAEARPDNGAGPDHYRGF